MCMFRPAKATPRMRQVLAVKGLLVWRSKQEVGRQQVRRRRRTKCMQQQVVSLILQEAWLVSARERRGVERAVKATSAGMPWAGLQREWAWQGDTGAGWSEGAGRLAAMVAPGWVWACMVQLACTLALVSSRWARGKSKA